MRKITLVIGQKSSGKSTYIQNHYPQLNLLPKDISSLPDQFDYVVEYNYTTHLKLLQFIEKLKAKDCFVEGVVLKTPYSERLLNYCFNKKIHFQTESILSITDREIYIKQSLFDSYSEVDFCRQWDESFNNKALLLDYDGTLRKSLGERDYPTDIKHVDILPNRIEILNSYKEHGYRLLGVSNQSAVSRDLPRKKCEDCFLRTNHLLGLEIEVQYCCHPSKPVICYCRKPSPEMGVYFIKKYKLNPSLCIMVGDREADEIFAKQCGFQFYWADYFFKGYVDV